MAAAGKIFPAIPSSRNPPRGILDIQVHAPDRVPNEEKGANSPAPYL
jgi:hypothetical protein